MPSSGPRQARVALLASLTKALGAPRMPTGGAKVPTPYFPASGGLLMAVAMLADGWREIPGRKWPRSWTCEAEGFVLGI